MTELIIFFPVTIAKFSCNLSKPQAECVSQARDVVINIDNRNIPWSSYFCRGGVSSVLPLLPSSFATKKPTREICQLHGSQQRKKREGNVSY